MSYDLTASIKPAIERMLNLGAKFCCDLAVKVGVFRGRTVAHIERPDVASRVAHESAGSSEDDRRPQIFPEQLGGNGKVGLYREDVARQVRANSIAKRVKHKKDRWWEMVRSIVEVKLTELIPDGVKYLREQAKNDAETIFFESLKRGKSLGEAKKEVMDSNIFKEYENKAKNKIAENEKFEQLWNSEGSFVGSEGSENKI